jgi:hypothetical protein
LAVGGAGLALATIGGFDGLVGAVDGLLGGVTAATTGTATAAGVAGVLLSVLAFATVETIRVMLRTRRKRYN